MHLTSLPGRWGIGDLGLEARRFADFLHAGRQHLWQVLPVRPTGYGDSPYQALSAFAGNPLLISPDLLIEDGLLESTDLEGRPAFSSTGVDYGTVIPFKRRLLTLAHRRFQSEASSAFRADFEAFCRRNGDWLDDFALYLALKDNRGGRPWIDWEDEIALRHPEALREQRRLLAEPMSFHRFAQFLFRRQWDQFKAHCRRRNLRLMGDVPIFMAHDSVDVWSKRRLFQLDERGRALEVAGVPPDYFSETGQLWGNPLYDWAAQAESGYDWWVERMRSELSLVDVVRLDHFRGFEAYWAVPGDAAGAVKGVWRKGPGAALFQRLEQQLGRLPIIAENLGFITPEVEDLRRRWGFPGMAILQFAFGSDRQANDFQPHCYSRDLVVYTGTHDNDTIQGWWKGGVGESTRSPRQVKQEKDLARRYLATDGRDIHWVFIRAAMASVADVAIFPLQDVLGLGSGARMNRPGREEGNWRWRLRPSLLSDDLANRLRDMAELYQRTVDDTEST